MFLVLIKILLHQNVNNVKMDISLAAIPKIVNLVTLFVQLVVRKGFAQLVYQEMSQEKMEEIHYALVKMDLQLMIVVRVLEKLIILLVNVFYYFLNVILKVLFRKFVMMTNI